MYSFNKPNRINYIPVEILEDIVSDVENIAEHSLNTADRRVCNNVLKIIELRSKGWIYNTSKWYEL